MENTNNYDDILSFVAPKESDSYIKVIGVGGGGCNAVNHMYRQGIVGVNFVVCNTDAQALQQSPVPVKLQLGRTKGLGAGNVPAVAQQAALEKKEEIKEIISDNTHMLFVTAGMGGGTGTGAAPVVAAVAKEIELDDDVKEILVVGIVSTPFSFEGRRRLQQAQEGIKELRKYVDAILVINNDNLRTMGGKMPFKDALAKADDVLSTAAKGISEIITVHTMINVDFRDVNTVMSQSGVALMGVGRANGENRAQEAIMAAMDSPLLNDNSIEGAKSILLCVIGSEKSPLLLEEVYVVAEFVRSHVGNEVEVIYGAGADNCEEDYLQVTLVATGFNERSYEQQTRMHLAEIRTDGTEVRIDERVENRLGAPVMATEPAPMPVPTLTATPTVADVKEETKRFVALDETPAAQKETPVATVEEKPASAQNLAQAWFDDMSFAPAAEVSAPVQAEAPAFAPLAETQVEVHAEMPIEMPMVAHVEAPAVAAEAHVEVSAQAFTPWNGDRGFSAADLEAVGKDMQLVSRPEGYQPEAQPEYATQTAVMDMGPATSYAQHPAYQDRMMRMRRFKEQLESNGMDFMERVPAWKRKEMELNPSVPAAQSEMGDMMITPDGRITKNAYLRDNERVD
ncbi:MAG: cell division protein FtsZ [Bacteroidales bacterium]|nr:cell division protein FtsZ [Bacteroidales bacterium]